MSSPALENSNIEDGPLDHGGVALPERRSNRPITFMHRLEYGLVLGLVGFFRLVGLDAASAIAGGFMGAVGPRLRSISKRAEDNLRAAFPDWTDAQVKQTTREVWTNLGRVGAEFAHLEKFRPFVEGGRVTVSGAERLRAIASRGKPAILVSGHFANWEIMSITFHHAGLSYGVVYRAANNPFVDELIIKTRGAVMSRHQIPKGKRGGRALMENLKAGRSLAMLVDQKLNDGLSVPFMGREAMTAPAAARLALKFSLPIIPVSIERKKGAHFHVTAHEPLDFTPGGDTAEDVYALTKAINEKLEEFIRARPGEWLWLHRRWPKEK